jgi:putative hemolysin
MIRKASFNLFVLIGIALSAGCGTTQVSPTPQANLPNPASAYCEQQGGKLEIVTAADGSQSGVCIFPDDSQCDEWAYLRGECGPAEAGPSPTAPTETPAAPTVDPTGYQGWSTYTHPVYNFSIMLPEDWVMEEAPTSDPLLGGHLLNLRPAGDDAKESVRMTFRRQGEQTLLWPTGVGQGEFIPKGTLEVAGQPAQRMLLVCPGGEVTSIWYHEAEGEPNITRDGLEFGIIFSAAPSHCEAGYSLDGEVQRTGEMIIASLDVPS